MKKPQLKFHFYMHCRWSSAHPNFTLNYFFVEELAKEWRIKLENKSTEIIQIKKQKKNKENDRASDTCEEPSINQ